MKIVPSMDANWCIMGVQRFVSRQGTTAIIWSDYGASFIGAKKELRENSEKRNAITISAEVVHKLNK